MNNIRAGAIIPLFVVVPAEFVAPVVTAEILALAPFELLETMVPLELIPGTPGYFANEEILMPEKPFIHVIYTLTDEDSDAVLVIQEKFGLERVQIADGELMLGTILDSEFITAEIVN